MKVLVTNDDGIERPGLLAVASRLVDAGHEVRVYGPAREFSGSSASLGTVAKDALIETHAVKLPGLDDVPALGFQAPPAVAVRAVCTGRFGWRPDLVVSGINPGFNTGRVVVHSGTVGAALTAVSCDVQAIAVSTDHRGDGGFDTAAILAAALAGVLVELAPGEPVALNLNVPAVPMAELRGVSDARLSPVSLIDLAFDGGEDGLVVRRVEHEPPFEPGTDAALLSAGWAALTTLLVPWASAPGAAVPDFAGELARRCGFLQSPPTPPPDTEVNPD